MIFERAIRKRQIQPDQDNRIIPDSHDSFGGSSLQLPHTHIWPKPIFIHQMMPSVIDILCVLKYEKVNCQASVQDVIDDLAATPALLYANKTPFGSQLNTNEIFQKQTLRCLRVLHCQNAFGDTLHHDLDHFCNQDLDHIDYLTFQQSSFTVHRQRQDGKTWFSTHSQDAKKCKNHVALLPYGGMTVPEGHTEQVYAAVTSDSNLQTRIDLYPVSTLLSVGLIAPQTGTYDGQKYTFLNQQAPPSCLKRKTAIGTFSTTFSFFNKKIEYAAIHQKACEQKNHFVIRLKRCDHTQEK